MYVESSFYHRVMNNCSDQGKFYFHRCFFFLLALLINVCLFDHVHRTTTVEVGPLGAAYLRLWFNGWQAGRSGTHEVHLFLNDAEEGQSEECHLFIVREANPSFR